jgi:hypothetical protein
MRTAVDSARMRLPLYEPLFKCASMNLAMSVALEATDPAGAASTISYLCGA